MVHMYMNRELQNLFDCVHYILFLTIYMFFQAQVSLYHCVTSFIREYLITWVIFWCCWYFKDNLKDTNSNLIIVYVCYKKTSEFHIIHKHKLCDLFKLLIKQTLFNIRWQKIYIAILRTKCKCKIKSLWTYV